MTEFLRAIKPLVPLIPLGVVVVAAGITGLTLLRIRRGRPKASSLRRSILDVLAAASVAGILILTLPPSIDAGRQVELVPFGHLPHGSVSNAQMLANVVMFIPLGIFAPARWPRFDGFVRIAMAGLLLSLSVEVLQFALDLGRQASTTDVLLNTVGAVLGYVILRGVRRAARGRDADARSVHRVGAA